MKNLYSIPFEDFLIRFEFEYLAVLGTYLVCLMVNPALVSRLSELVVMVSESLAFVSGFIHA